MKLTFNYLKYVYTHFRHGLYKEWYSGLMYHGKPVVMPPNKLWSPLSFYRIHKDTEKLAKAAKAKYTTPPANLNPKNLDVIVWKTK